MTTGKWLNQHRFRILFGSFLALLLALPLSSGSEGPSLLTLLFVANFLAAGYAAAPNKLHFQLLVGLALAAIVMNVAMRDSGVRAARYVVFAIAYATLFTTLMGHVLRAKRITVEEVFAALTGYMFLLMLWTALYGLTAMVDADAFTPPTPGAPADRDFLYFSIVTQTTLGYGDIHPVAPTARMLAGLQAIVGQIYLAVLVARLVAMQITSSSEAQK